MLNVYCLRLRSKIIKCSFSINTENYFGIFNSSRASIQMVFIIDISISINDMNVQSEGVYIVCVMHPVAHARA